MLNESEKVTATTTEFWSSIIRSPYRIGDGVVTLLEYAGGACLPVVASIWRFDQAANLWRKGTEKTFNDRNHLLTASADQE